MAQKEVKLYFMEVVSMAHGRALDSKRKIATTLTF